MQPSTIENAAPTKNAPVSQPTEVSALESASNTTLTAELNARQRDSVTTPQRSSMTPLPRSSKQATLRVSGRATVPPRRSPAPVRRVTFLRILRPSATEAEPDERTTA